jgi:hypothetical protein
MIDLISKLKENKRVPPSLSGSAAEFQEDNIEIKSELAVLPGVEQSS